MSRYRNSELVAISELENKIRTVELQAEESNRNEDQECLRVSTAIIEDCRKRMALYEESILD